MMTKLSTSFSITKTRLFKYIRRGGSNEYPQSMFRAGIKKNNVYPCKPQFYYIKVEVRGGSTFYRHVFVMERLVLFFVCFFFFFFFFFCFFLACRFT